MPGREQTVGALLRSALQTAGFGRHGRACYLSFDELIWVVTPEQLWSGPSWAIRVGVVARWLTPEMEWPTDKDVHLQTEPRFMTDLDGADADGLDGPTVKDALLNNSALSVTERTAALQRLAVALHTVLSQLSNRRDLAREVGAGRLRSALMLKELRATLDDQ